MQYQVVKDPWASNGRWAIVRSDGRIVSFHPNQEAAETAKKSLVDYAKHSPPATATTSLPL